MMISTKGRYALRVMLDLSEQDTNQYISLKEVSQRQDISMKYLESIVSVLTKGSMLQSQRGKEGGYRLARPAQGYTVGEILRLTEGGLAPVACLSCQDNACERASDCQTLPLWQGLDACLNNYLDKITLADLRDGYVPPPVQG